MKRMEGTIRGNFARRAGLPGAAAALALAACEPAPRVVHVPVETQPQIVEVPVEVPVPVELCERPVLQGGRAFVAEAWAVPDGQFDVGEPLRLQMRVSAPAYVNLFHVGTSCKVTRLLRDRQVRETEIVDFPPAGGGVAVTVKPPAGDEAFYLLATRAPADFLASGDLLGGSDIASVDLAPEQFYARLRQAVSRIDPNDVSMTTLRTTVVAQ